MSVVETVKNNPGKIIFGSASTIISVVAALFALDARYAHASDVEKDKQQTQQIILETSRSLRQQMLEDKLFELDVKKEQSRDRRLSPIDSALKERYQRQINELSTKKLN